MKALVVYDSVFGNTERVAQAIGRALGSSDHVATLRVSSVKPEHLSGLDLLVVGSPTRAFRPTKDITALIGRIPSQGLRGVRVAAFDTRINTVEVKSAFLAGMVKVFGYAADPIAAGLKKKGGELIVPPQWYYVKESEGPLKEGELERAVEWAGQISQALKGQRPPA